MRSDLVAIGAVLASLLVPGCGASYHAGQFLKPGTAQGWNRLAALRDDEALVRQGTISGHRVIETLDGVKIDTWWLDPAGGVQTPRGTVVVLHGTTESKAVYLDVGRNLSEMGYAVILPDLRIHGASTGSYVTHGLKEKFDVKRVVDVLLADGEVSRPIYCAGASLGAVTAIQYAAIDDRCKGVMAIDAYTSLRDYVEWNMRLVSPSERAATIGEIERVAGMRVGEASALAALDSVECPILFAHGVIDGTVPKAHTKKLHAAAPEPKELVIVEPLSLALKWKQWMAEQIDRLARTSLRESSP